MGENQLGVKIEEVRKKLENSWGKEYWRSLDEVAGTPEFREFLHREFPQGASELSDPLTRRSFLKVMAASLGLAGLAACRPQPSELIVPYVDQPEEIVQGEPLFFATADVLSGYAMGVFVKSHMGRPIKLEGNPEHPASLGASDVFAQAAVLTLYDPDRSQVVTHQRRIRSWENFFAVFTPLIGAQRLVDGAGLRILTETVTSPTLADQLRRLMEMFPQARWHQYEPVNRDNSHAGMLLAFREPASVAYRFDRAEVVISLDADFLHVDQARVRHTRDFAEKRRVLAGQTGMNRLYLLESALSLTGAMADHRLALPPSQIEPAAMALANQAGVGVEAAGDLPQEQVEWISAAVRDLRAHEGAGIVLAGEGQPPPVHALAHAMNQALGNVGRTVFYMDPVEADPGGQRESLQELVRDMQAGRVEILVILDGNPAYNAPADLNFALHLAQVDFKVHLSLYADETSALCDWHLPQAHYLETWSDARAYDGTVTILQPLIQPLYTGRSAHELISAILEEPGLSGYDIVRGFWEGQLQNDNFEVFWREALHAGLIPGTASPSKNISVDLTRLAGQLSRNHQAREGNKEFEILFRPDPTIWDGRFANNGWLQELPKPITKLTWDNPVMVSPATAERLGLANEDLVSLGYGGQTAEAPVWITPGHADGCATVFLGYGRWRAGRVGTGMGYNAYVLRTLDTPWFGAGLELAKTGRKYELASTQLHFNMEGRNLVRAATLARFLEEPHFALEEADEHALPSLYPEFTYDRPAWGMVIDLNSCTGCNACVIACQAENNIPVVGKDQVALGREMHWIRVDHYFQGNLDQPQILHQPVTCMHCENAPCEIVCPVAATVHSEEGLNEMIYNRCVGTRYCSHNCPYKVRRFNFLEYADHDTPSLKLLNNPDVTVRGRGVMEKCTYCVQRINRARIHAKREGRLIRDGEVVTACQQACPARAITFGDINDPESQVAGWRAQPHNYGLLAELNTRPRTTYLAKLTNPNPETDL